jgi:hypothetical protein
MKQKSRVFLGIATFALAALMFFVSCGDTGTDGEVDVKWVVNASVSRDANTGQAGSYLSLTRDGVAYTAALVKLTAPAGDSADTISLMGGGDGTYRLTFTPQQLRDTTNITVKSLLDQFQFSFQLSVPESLGLEVVGLPDFKVLSSTQQVQVRWIAPKYAEGYILVVQPASTSSSAVGYKRILTPGEYGQDPPYSTALIPNTAFRSTQSEFQAGVYNVWIAAYHDSPINTNQIPFTLPSGFTRNVDRTGITGQIGALFIGRVVNLTAVAPS